MMQFAAKTIPVPLQHVKVRFLRQPACSNLLPGIQLIYVFLLQMFLAPIEHLRIELLVQSYLQTAHELLLGKIH